MLYTSQTCPKCGHVEKTNRDKKNHIFKCKTCGYTSNDDRIGAMNLHRKEIEYLSAVAAE
jgi:transposase